MSEQDRLKWDQRYAEGAYQGRGHPSDFLRRQLPGLEMDPAIGRLALDVACGAGRNSLYLAANGFSVDGLDISQQGLDRARQRELAAADGAEPVCWICCDLLDAPEIPRQGYALIIVFRFVAAALMPQLLERLAAGGYLMCENHLQWPQPAGGPLAGPRGARFRLAQGEMDTWLQTWAQAGLRVAPRILEEGLYDEPDGSRAALARLLVQKQA